MNYSIVAIRALWDNERMPVFTIWKKRREMEIILLANDIVAIFVYNTLQEKKACIGRRKQENKIYIKHESDEEESESEYWIEKIELALTKQFLDAGLNIRKCKAV